MPRQAAALLQLLRMPPAADAATAMRWAVKQGSLKARTYVLQSTMLGTAAHSQGLRPLHFTEHRCHVWQGRPDLDALRDGISWSSLEAAGGQQGTLRALIWFCMQSLNNMCAEGAALDPDPTCTPYP